MKFLAIDLGLSRTGIAISDDLEMMAIPLKTIRQKNKDKLLNEISELVKVYNIDKIIYCIHKHRWSESRYRERRNFSGSGKKGRNQKQKYDLQTGSAS